MDNNCDLGLPSVRAILDRYAEELEKIEGEKAIAERIESETRHDEMHGESETESKTNTVDIVMNGKTYRINWEVVC